MAWAAVAGDGPGKVSRTGLPISRACQSLWETLAVCLGPLGSASLPVGHRGRAAVCAGTDASELGAADVRACHGSRDLLDQAGRRQGMLPPEWPPRRGWFWEGRAVHTSPELRPGRVPQDDGGNRRAKEKQGEERVPPASHWELIHALFIQPNLSLLSPLPLTCTVLSQPVASTQGLDQAAVRRTPGAIAQEIPATRPLVTGYVHSQGWEGGRQ